MMRIAYIISAHKLPKQLTRMVKRLATEGASFFIHIDKRTPADLFEEMKRGLAGESNVFFIKRHKCYWGEALEASLEGFRALFASRVAFDRVVLLSGQDYPLRSAQEIEAYFDAHREDEFIEWTDFRDAPPDAAWPDSGKARVENWHFKFLKMNFVVPGKLEWNTINRYCRSGHSWMPVASKVWSALMRPLPIKRQFPAGLQPYFYGSAFCCLSRKCAEFIHGLMGQRHPFFRFFMRSDMAEEMFYQSVVLSSPFKDRVVNDNLFFIDWKNPNPAVPRTWVEGDFNRLINSSKLFARKFDMDRDTEIFDMLDRSAAGKTNRAAIAAETSIH